MTKAQELLEKSKDTKARAESFFTTIKRNIQKNILDELTAKKEAITDQLFDLSNFQLNTNLNAGVKEMTREECEKRFAKIIELEFEAKVIDLELKSKQESFNTYFNEVTVQQA